MVLKARQTGTRIPALAERRAGAGCGEVQEAREWARRNTEYYGRVRRRGRFTARGRYRGERSERKVALPAVLPAVSGSASRFRTRWDLFGSPLWSINAGVSEFSALARPDYESVALQTEPRWCTTAPRRTMQQRIVNRTPQTELMTRVVWSRWTSASCRAVPRMRSHLSECRRPWDMGAAIVTTGSNRVSAAAPLTQLMPARRTNRAAPVASASVRQVSLGESA